MIRRELEDEQFLQYGFVSNSVGIPRNIERDQMCPSVDIT